MRNSFSLFFFLLFLLHSSLIAFQTQLLTEYRLHGIDGIEKKLDKELTNQAYWQNYIKKSDTKFGYLESYTNVLACNKANSDLLVYQKESNNTFILKKDYSAFTGKIKGDKSTEGDLKTPVGVYNLLHKLSNVDEFYGPLAFVTSYPNIYDKYRGKTGQGIWIHGLPLHQKRDSFTKGCIAIGNKNIICLDKHLNLQKTLLVINEDCNYTKVSKKELSLVLSQIYAWRYAWKYNNLDDYLNFYSTKFIRYDGMKLAEFKRYKKRIFAKNEKKSIIFTEINVIPYPLHQHTFKVTFQEFYKTNHLTFNGKKTLIVALKNSKMKILTEK